MNIPPPAHGTLKIKVESGDPVVVRYEHGGVKYTLRVVTNIVAVWPTGKKDAQGNPEFSINMSPIITVTKEQGVSS
jgi:hypothetical protein